MTRKEFEAELKSMGMNHGKQMQKFLKDKELCKKLGESVNFDVTRKKESFKK